MYISALFNLGVFNYLLNKKKEGVKLHTSSAKNKKNC